MKKPHIACVASVLTVIVVLASLTPAQALPGLPLSALAGNWAGEGSSTFEVCFNSDFSAVEDCSTAPESAFYNETFVYQGTSDKSGNSCSTLSITNAPEFASPVTPANAFAVINVGKTTSYNQSTETGTVSFTSYNVGSGTSCNGSVLVNTANAQPTGTSTGSCAISQHGSRDDCVTTTLVNSPISDVGDYVGHNVAFKQ
ncbi:MAG TPA: hypothetical protein VMF50_09280 [Candidatus Binataceae bacterium]|nr:hypothetical protein [Candidatus Binataceae bacterium]